MTIKQLRKLLKGLDPAMDVLLLQPDGSAISACFENSDLARLEIEGEETGIAFLLVPCGCTEDVETDIEEISLN